MPFRKNPAEDSRSPREQVSKLAYRLWEARGHPLGSSDVDWFFAETLVAEYRQASPFDEFLWKAGKALNSPIVVRGEQDVVEYARVIEERRYVIDILDRVEMLAFAYSRLESLTALYRRAEANVDVTKRVSKTEPLTWEFPDEIAWHRDHLALEARTLVSLIYYELTSVTHMLKDLGVQPALGELQYLVKARDKFLAHPQLRGRARNAHGAMHIPQDGLLHAHAVNADETDPVLHDYYASCFALTEGIDETRTRSENEKLILSSKKNFNFSSNELLCLKAFGIREPNLEASLAEMAKLLLMSALGEIERISAYPIPSRR